MRAPESAIRNSSNPGCWNARRRRLLHSGPNVFVIILDRPPAARAAVAPALGRATRAHRGAGTRSRSHFPIPHTAGELPKPSPKSAPPLRVSQSPRLC